MLFIICIWVSVTVNGFTTVCSCNHITVTGSTIRLQTKYHIDMKQTAQQSQHENRIGIAGRITSRCVTGETAWVGLKSKRFLKRMVRHGWGLNQSVS